MTTPMAATFKPPAPTSRRSWLRSTLTLMGGTMAGLFVAKDRAIAMPLLSRRFPGIVTTYAASPKPTIMDSAYLPWEPDPKTGLVFGSLLIRSRRPIRFDDKPHAALGRSNADAFMGFAPGTLFVKDVFCNYGLVEIEPGYDEHGQGWVRRKHEPSLDYLDYSFLYRPDGHGDARRISFKDHIV